MVKKVLLNIICLFLIIMICYCCLKLLKSSFFSKEYEIVVNSKNKEEIMTLVSNITNDSEKITKIVYSPRLGDGELYIYEGFKKYDKGLVSEGNEIAKYLMNNGKNPSINYILLLAISFIIVLFIRTYFNECDN